MQPNLELKPERRTFKLLADEGDIMTSPFTYLWRHYVFHISPLGGVSVGIGRSHWDREAIRITFGPNPN